MPRIFDPGLQPERTLLAWRRTSLALVVAAIVGVRLVPELFGVFGYVIAAAGLVTAAAIALLAERNHRRLVDRLLGESPGLVGNGRLIAATAIVAVIAGGLALAIGILAVAGGLDPVV